MDSNLWPKSTEKFKIIRKKKFNFKPRVLPIFIAFSPSRFIILIARLSGIPIPWYKNETTAKKVGFICLDVAISVFLVYKVMCATYAFGHNEKLADVIFSGAQIAFMMNGPIIGSFYAASRKKFKTLTDSLDELNQTIARAGLGNLDYFERLYKEDARKLKKLTKIMVNSTIVCPITTCFSNPIVGLIDGSYGTRLSLPIHCLFEMNNRSIFELIILTEFCGLIYPALQKLMNEFMVLILLRSQTTYFKYLRQVLSNIEVESRQDVNIVREKLVVWIQIHQAVLRNTRDIIALFSPAIVFYLLSFIGVIAGTVLYQLKATENNILQTGVIGLYTLIMVVHFYLQCHMADELTTAGENIAIAAYSMKWYDMDTRAKGFVRLIISMANKPIEVMAYKAPAFAVNKEVFLSFMTSTVSAYMAFSTIMENTN